MIVSGDVWDRPVPPMDALTLGLQTLLRLAERRPVVAVAGNHDSPELFEALAPLLRPRGVFLVGTIRRPDDGGILGPDDLGVPAVLACFPFLREGRVVDFMKDAGEWYGDYASTRRSADGRLQRRPGRARRHRARPAARGALHGRRHQGGPSGAARRTRAAHGRRLRRHRPGDPRRATVRRDGPHPRTATGAGRADPRRVRRLAPRARLRRGGRVQAGRDRRGPAGFARDRHVGRDRARPSADPCERDVRGARGSGRPRRGVPRPHGRRRRHSTTSSGVAPRRRSPTS